MYFTNKSPDAPSLINNPRSAPSVPIRRISWPDPFFNIISASFCTIQSPLICWITSSSGGASIYKAFGAPTQMPNSDASCPPTPPKYPTASFIVPAL